MRMHGSVLFASQLKHGLESLPVCSLDPEAPADNPISSEEAAVACASLDDWFSALLNSVLATKPLTDACCCA